MNRFLTSLLLISLLFTGFVWSQPQAAKTAAKKSYTLHGKVESMNAKAQSMTIDGEAVVGWMGAMSMEYKVDNADAFKTVKVGDAIEATVYEGDGVLYKLHTVKLAPKK